MCCLHGTHIGRVDKTVFHEKRRLLFVAGLEGTGRWCWMDWWVGGCGRVDV